jgi:hypothetical protein
VLDYQVVPDGVGRLVGRFLPWIEVILGCALLAGLGLPVTGGLTVLLLASFTIAVVINLRRGRRISCSCNGLATTTTIGTGTVARNGALMILGATTSGVAALTLPPDRWLSRSFEVLVPLISTAAILTVVLLVCWCVAMVYLIEWGLDIQSRGSRLARWGWAGEATLVWPLAVRLQRPELFHPTRPATGDP